ncbi:hypothetical protein PAMP_016115 [Pampus punctatissimus]
MVSVGEQVRERDGERDTGGDSVASGESLSKNYIPGIKDSSPLPQDLFLTYHHLLSRPQPRGINAESLTSIEGLTFDLPDHAHYHRSHGNVVWL